MESDSPHIIDEILLAKYFAQETSAQEEEQIRHWLNQNIQNQASYEHLKKVWQGVEPYRNLRNVDTEAAWQKFKKNIDTEHSSAKTKVIKLESRHSKWRLWQVAAAAILLVGLGWAIWSNSNTQQPQMLLVETRQTGKNVVFSDGSKVFLNKNSRLEYPQKFENSARNIILKGEGFFEVTPAKIPFIVKTPHFDVKVLGTSFNVKAYPEAKEQEVIVKTGKVAVSSKAKEILLKPNEKVQLTAQATEMKKSQNDNPNYDSYQSQVFIFEATPLSQVLTQLNEVYGSEIRLSDESLGQCTLTVTFREESLENILEIILETLSLQLHKKGEQVFLSGEGC